MYNNIYTIHTFLRYLVRLYVYVREIWKQGSWSRCTVGTEIRSALGIFFLNLSGTEKVTSCNRFLDLPM